MQLPSKIPMMIPRINFTAKEAPKFKKKDIFMISGHGKENTEGYRFEIGGRQNALIPGVCGTSISTESDIYNTFFSNSDTINEFSNINVFSQKTNNKRVSSSLGFEYSMFIPLVNGGEHKITKIKQLKHYRAGGLGRNELPQLSIIPIIMGIQNTAIHQYIYIELSGILRKSNPYEMTVVKEWEPEELSGQNNGNKQLLLCENDDLTLTIKQAEEAGPDNRSFRILNVIRESLKESVLSFDDILLLSVLHKFGTVDGRDIRDIHASEVFDEWQKLSTSEESRAKMKDIMLADFFNLRVPLQFFFQFLDTQTADPYLVIVLTCRAYELPIIPPTPSRRKEKEAEREHILRFTGPALRRSSSTGSGNLANLFSNPHLLNSLSSGSETPISALSASPSVESVGAGGGGGGGSPVGLGAPTVGLSSLGLGSLSGYGRKRRVTRRRRRVHQKRLTRRKKLKTDK
jgi:hypothetical protein